LDYETVAALQNFPTSSLSTCTQINVVTENKFRFLFVLSHLRPSFNCTDIYCNSNRVSTM
jgi:hypothetical protein